MSEIIEWVMSTPPIMFEVFRAVQITQWASSFFKEQLSFFQCCQTHQCGAFIQKH